MIGEGGPEAITPLYGLGPFVRSMLFNHGPIIDLIDLGFRIYDWPEAKRRADELREMELLREIIVTPRGTPADAERMGEIEQRWRTRDSLRTRPCPRCPEAVLRWTPDTAEFHCDACHILIADLDLIRCWDYAHHGWRSTPASITCLERERRKVGGFV